MCGILGCVADNSAGMRERLEHESDRMQHRGPDGSGIWEGDGTAFAHRRLRILDLSDRSDQPALSPDANRVLTFNGEIYNFGALHEPPFASDTLALAHIPGLTNDPARLRGMFAYGTWERGDSQLTLARDRFGMKPLYYSSRERSLLFGSTASAVAALAECSAIDRTSVATFLRSGSVQGPRTMFTRVTELDPGNTLVWRDGSATVSRYWGFHDPSDASPGDLRAVLLDAVAAHGISDVPVALFLSGGVDSALVGALAMEAGLDVTAFTLGFPGADIDETEEATATARSLGITHEVVSWTEAFPDFDAYLSSCDQPSIDGLNTFMVSQAAASHGFRVALTGLGADELFCGYSTFQRVPALWALNLLPLESVRSWLIGMSSGNKAKAPGLAAAGADFSAIYEELRSVFTREEVYRLCGMEAARCSSPVSPLAPMDAVTRLETDYYLRNTLLRDADVFSMAHSLELRTPFVDHRVLAAALQIPNRQRARLRKRLLVESVGHQRLSELSQLPKRGFRLPMDRWLRGPLSSRVDALPDGALVDVCDRQEVRRHVDDWHRGRSAYAKVWALVTLAAWLEAH